MLALVESGGEPSGGMMGFETSVAREMSREPQKRWRGALLPFAGLKLEQAREKAGRGYSMWRYWLYGSGELVRTIGALHGEKMLGGEFMSGGEVFDMRFERLGCLFGGCRSGGVELDCWSQGQVPDKRSSNFAARRTLFFYYL